MTIPATALLALRHVLPFHALPLPGQPAADA